MISLPCDICDKTLGRPGALVFSPPDDYGNTKTRHVCVGCWQTHSSVAAIIATLFVPEQGDYVEEPDPIFPLAEPNTLHTWDTCKNCGQAIGLCDEGWDGLNPGQDEPGYCPENYTSVGDPVHVPRRGPA